VSKRLQINLSTTLFASLALLLGVSMAGCHKEEQAVVGVAQHAVNAEQQAQQAAQAAAATPTPAATVAPSTTLPAATAAPTTAPTVAP